MTWVLVIALALVAFCVIVFVFKAARGTREAVAAALLLGIAGYVMQGSPGMAGAPKPPAESISGDPAALVKARLKVTNSDIPTSDYWVVVADGLARNGHYADAADILRGAVEKNPADSEAWLAMGNALLAHSQGLLTPASLYAYRSAAKTDPTSPGPPFFLGMALIQNGKLAQGRELWADLLKRAPADAKWRAPLEQQLQKLDAVMAGQGQAPMQAGDQSDSSSSR